MCAVLLLQRLRPKSGTLSRRPRILRIDTACFVKAYFAFIILNGARPEGPGVVEGKSSFRMVSQGHLITSALRLRASALDESDLLKR